MADTAHTVSQARPNVTRRSIHLAVTLLALMMVLVWPSGKASADTLLCSDCHTMPPTDSAGTRDAPTGAFKGNHQRHAGAAVNSCTACHGAEAASYATGHSKEIVPAGNKPVIRLAWKLNNYSTASGRARYSRGTFFNQTSVPPVPMGTCSNVNCHFTVTTPSWGSANFASPTDCNKCHGAAPADGSHPKHATYYGAGAASCVKCHPDHTSEPKPFAHATSAGLRNLGMSFAAAPNNGSGTYSGPLNDYLPSQTNAFGNCNATYCHSPGNKAAAFDPPAVVPAWGGASLTCKGCHNSDYASGSAMSSGSHNGHITGSYNPFGYNLMTCVRCHATTASASLAIANVSRHVNGQVEIAFDSTSSAANGSYKGTLATPASPKVQAAGATTGGACTTVYCHSSGQGANGTWPPVYQAPIWGNAATGKCGTCHGEQFSHGGFSQGNPLTSGSHTKHLQSNLGLTGSDYVRCVACHAYTRTGLDPAGCNSNLCHPPTTKKHPNYAINVDIPDYFGATATYNGTTKPGDGYSTCSTVYCHSDGKAVPSTYATPAWGDAASAACGTCHGVSAANPPVSTPHTRHVGSANPYRFACAECHSGKVQVTASSTIVPAFTNLTTHVNKTRDVKFDGTNPFGTYSSATSSCRNLYCHSTGNTNVAAGNLPSIYAGKVYVRQGWTGSVTCTSCHGRSTSNGMPDYTNAGSPGSATSNSHPKHVASSNVQCVECHEKTTKTNTSIRPTTPSYHTNGGRNVFFNLSGANKNGSYNGTIGQKNCSSTYCHGSVSSIPWGGSTACTSCHGAAFTTFSSATKKGAHARHIETDANLPTSYAGAGLGNLSSDPAKYQFGCASCHNPSQAGHANTVANSGTGAAEVYFGYSSAGRKGTYAPGTVQAGTDNGFNWTSGNNCTTTYCHSNGNGANGASNVAWNSPNGTLACTGCHGDAASNTLSGKHQAHVNNAATFGTNNSFGCVECHAKTVSSNSVIGDKRKHVNKFKDYSGARAYGPSHYSTANKQCSNGYCHSNGKPNALVYINMTGSKVWTGSATFGCNGCHGRSNLSTGAPDYANGGAGTATANSHLKHVSQLNITNTTGCAACHNRTVAAATANKFRNYSTLHLNGAPNVAFDSAKAGVSAVWTAGTGTCTTVACHSNGRGSYQSPQWGQAGNCGFCHPIASLGGAHAKHMDLTKTPLFYSFTANRSSGDDATGKYYFGCSNCHPLANGNHANGTIVLDFKPAVAGVSTLRSKNSATITASGAVGTANSGTSGTSGTTVACVGVYCHSNGYSTNLVYATTPNWYGGSFTDRCASCHGNSPNSTIAGSPAHYNNNFVGTGVTNGHLMGIHSDDIYTGTNGLATAGTGAASSHGNSAYSTTISCNICHNLTVASARNDSNTVCKTCHVNGNGVGAAFGNNAAIVNKAFHVSGQANVSFAAVTMKSKAQVRGASAVVEPYKASWVRVGSYKDSGSYDQNTFNAATIWNQSTKTCSNVACHNGQPVTWTSTGGATGCQSCHLAL